MQTDDVAVRVKPPGVNWQTLQADPQSPVLTANTWGADEARLEVRRDTRVPWADLAANTPIEIDIAGVQVWEGRLINTPSQDGASTIQLAAQGWQYALDRQPIRRTFVHDRLGDWKDWRSHLDADLTKFTAGWGVDAGSGAIVITNSEITTGIRSAGAYLDMGQTGAAKRVLVTFEHSDWAGGAVAYLRTSNTTGGMNTGVGDLVLSNPGAGAASGTAVFNTNARYVQIYVDSDTTQTAEQYLKITSVKVFGDAAYESGNASILKADDVVLYALANATDGLSSDYSEVMGTSFDIPHLAAPEFRSARDFIEGVNAFHNYVTKIGYGRKFIFRELPVLPMFRVGAWSDYDFQDASANNGSEIYDEVAVVGQAADGTELVVERSQMIPGLESPSRKVLDVSSPMTVAVAERLGDKFLEAHRRSSLQGTVSLTGTDTIRDNGGLPTHPSLLLLAAQERLRFDDRISPDTGGVGRDGQIVGVEYNHGDRSLNVEVDNSRRDWETILARYGLLAGGIAA